jgi:hypothetical protein
LVVELWLVSLLGADQQPHIGDGEHSDDIKNDWLNLLRCNCQCLCTWSCKQLMS